MSRQTIAKDGVFVTDKRTFNFVPGAGVAITLTDDGDSANIQYDIGAGLTITRGGTLYSSSGITGAVNLIAWRAPYACTLTKLYGYRVSGTAATVNARRGGASNHLATALSLTSTDTWMDGGTVQNTAYVAGDIMELMLVSVAGLPTSIAWQLEFERD